MSSKTGDRRVQKYAEVSWERMSRAVDKVRERVLRTARALRAGEISYAIVGGNAVAAWVARVDESAVRNTRDVDLLVRRDDLDRVKAQMQAAGFTFRHVKGIDMFLDGGGARDAVHVIFAGEKVRPDYHAAAPMTTESERTADFELIELEPLVRMKLTSFRDKDRVHIRDLISVGLVDESWCARFDGVLAERLRHILATPDD